MSTDRRLITSIMVPGATELYTAIKTNERILSRYTVHANMEESLPDL